MRDYVRFAVVAGAFVTAAACAKQQDKPPAAPPPAAPPVVTIHAKDFAYTMPDTVPAGYVTFHLVNDGPDLHHATIVRLDSGKTMADMEAALKHPGPLPAWLVSLGGPNAPAPGDTSNATLNLTAGSYAVLCFVDVPGGVPHFAKGMVHPLVVAAAAGGTPAAPPTADIAVTLVDYGFEFSKPLTAGHHVFAVTDSGPQMHELELVQLAPGKTGEDVVKWVQNPQGPPPGKPIGGIAGVVPHVPTYFSADLAKGNYLFICFVPDAKDGKPHFMHGMMHTETIE
ncbi:MAG TPA: hypothetical protein VFT41_13420 [Gemmatimonadaceae bacterium]|nr:hypothetical protein [Gemmatimonadaceae bacterium]